jgi:hypothetical protein
MQTTLRPNQPNLVVGWASTIVQVWPAEDPAIGSVAPFRRPTAPLATPEAVYELMAAVDGTDEATYRRRHAAEAGAVLALTHHSEIAVLEASLRVRGDLSPAAMLALLHADEDADAQRLAS